MARPLLTLNRGFELAANHAVTMLLDFDVAGPFMTANGRYMMSPVIGIVSIQ